MRLVSSQIYGISSIILHPNFNYPNTEDDIALVRLDRDVEWSEYAQPVCLPGYPRGGAAWGEQGEAHGMLAGWGLDAPARSTNPKWTEELQMVRLPVLSNNLCKEWFYDKEQWLNKKTHLTLQDKRRSLNGYILEKLYLTYGFSFSVNQVYPTK